jgi:hypothetical protein
LSQKEEAKAFARGGDDLLPMVRDQQQREIDSWAIRFQFAHFKYHAVSIMATRSYIHNIGFDGTGTHSLVVPQTDTRDKAIIDPVFPESLFEDSRVINLFYNYYNPKKRAVWKKVVNRLSRIVGGKNIFTIKEKVYCK